MLEVCTSNEKWEAVVSVDFCLSGRAISGLPELINVLPALFSINFSFKSRWGLYVAPIIFLILEIFLLSWLQVIFGDCLKLFGGHRHWRLISIPVFFLLNSRLFRNIQNIICYIFKFLSFFSQIPPFIDLLSYYWCLLLDLLLLRYNRGLKIAPLFGNWNIIELVDILLKCKMIILSLVLLILQ